VSKIATPAFSRVVIAAVLLLLVAHRGSPAASAASATAPPPPAPATTATCVFVNPAFAGKCTETATVAAGSTPTQACQVILQCLNSVDCLKTYCQATTVRQGWTLELAK
jgi:hypothetical protein